MRLKLAALVLVRMLHKGVTHKVAPEHIAFYVWQLQPHMAEVRVSLKHFFGN